MWICMLFLWRSKTTAMSVPPTTTAATAATAIFDRTGAPTTAAAAAITASSCCALLLKESTRYFVQNKARLVSSYNLFYFIRFECSLIYSNKFAFS